MSYDYFKSIKEDVLSYINNNIDLSNWYGTDPDYLKWELQDTLLDEDSITGNASGSYTFDRAKAREYVLDNMEHLTDAAWDYGINFEIIGKNFLDENWEYFDVLIRCYLLSAVIEEVVDEFAAENII